MTTKLRPGAPDDAEVCGQICFEAFGSISAAHGFPSDFPSPEVATGLVGMMLGHPGFYSVVAEVDGEVVGSNFLDERSPIVGMGPITVAPGVTGRRHRPRAHGWRAGPRRGYRCAGCAPRFSPPTTTARWPCTRSSGSRSGRRSPACRAQPCPCRSPAMPSARQPPSDIAACDALCLTGPRPPPPRRGRRRRRPEQRPGGRARRQDQRLQHRTGVLRPHRGRDQRRPQGPHRLGIGVRRPGDPRAALQQRAGRLVPRAMACGSCS